MDCNWCAVCSNHFHSDHQESLYCSEECRKADALACCAFHDCDHPDESKHHDHLTFCHHHRPAIRIPTLPLLNLNSQPSPEQQLHGQRQEDEWMSFVQQQYNTQYHSHYSHTSMLHNVSHSHGPITTNQSLIDDRLEALRGFQSGSLNLKSRTVPLQDIASQKQREAQSQQRSYFKIRQGSPSSCSSYQTADDGLASLAARNLSISDPLRGPPRQEHCEQPCVVRKNKALPPPTLSHILPAKISNPASLSPKGLVGSLDSKSYKSAPTSPVSPGSPSSANEGDDGIDALSHSWPQMDKFFFPDHCCRISACRTTSSPSIGQKGTNKKKGGKNSKSYKKDFISELPLPPISSNTHIDSDGCIALSASIWGAGWRQVEPLPESFVKTVQKNRLLWAGCEREHRPHARGYQRNRRIINKTQGQNCSNGRVHCGINDEISASNGDDGNQEYGISGARYINTHYKNNMSDSSSWATECSSRLPRSLQFIE
ncbi:hypothetical protein BGZ76_010894 [Entomortierella beljakovae]|nr:hypothetical protein BGZ76_010894 [Entomortierella beljakovae]